MFALLAPWCNKVYKFCGEVYKFSCLTVKTAWS